uniref:Cnidarian restricted protein n=1 Tax=Clytia hemisphaerica TaxID=252671 RepID=A0A7M6DLL8_9CNID
MNWYTIWCLVYLLHGIVSYSINLLSEENGNQVLEKEEGNISPRPSYETLYRKTKGVCVTNKPEVGVKVNLTSSQTTSRSRKWWPFSFSAFYANVKTFLSFWWLGIVVQIYNKVVNGLVIFISAFLAEFQRQLQYHPDFNFLFMILYGCLVNFIIKLVDWICILPQFNLLRVMVTLNLSIVFFAMAIEKQYFKLTFFLAIVFFSYDNN